MNGEINPNAGKMAGFGQGQNHMKSGAGGGGVNIADVLPKDPFKDPLNGRGRWLKQSDQSHQQKQAQLAAEQDKFVPEAFKRDGAMGLDIKGNKATGKQTTWLDNNSKLKSSQQAQKQKQQQQQQQQQKLPQQQQPQRQQYSSMNQHSNHNDNPNNHGHGGMQPNNMPSQNSHNNNHQNMQRPMNHNNAPNNMGMNPNMHGQHHNNNNNNNNMTPINNMPQSMNMNSGVDPNANQNQPRPTYDMTQQLSKPQGLGVKDKPKPEPYYSHKQEDPFSKFYNTAQYKRDLKNHGNVQHGYHNKNVQEPNYRAYNAKPNNAAQQQQQSIYSSGKKESENWSGVPNRFSQKMEKRCIKCAGPIQDTWTEDSQQRMFHDECFVCLVCGSKLGPIGTYIAVNNGVVCKQCRSQQLASQ
mmetsp:Transcript_1028/g.2005  ORF Transcript_1028/g.2005 Transcript_1028/m.2005 type:complete len:411 (-) Transcript_1028:69-1301(-)|eukprot:CAMPEP_0202712708 /NCGR_PEP_ID=MMETSP1385-20130828/44312_1 /ASSEMBLY_ACC=CAM_ASM_000861 /TAXON_ID=933848 /ORGANISM="Elphidium margaritaceum" /LENGTH=410 /DNA_ID=CAMNT_0049372815 /DNA_START=32 /DNA_END=1264 /DNA_ORIENTATION=-